MSELVTKAGLAEYEAFISAHPKGHFAQYARFKAQYPATEVLLSIGGWTYSGLFSKMSLTAESRAGFIQSCIEAIQAYPFLDGIDLDWEYPGIHRRATKADEGSPMVGDDWTNYTALLREMRAALDETFGQGVKRLTVCAPAAPSNLRKQDYPSLHPYVDAINLMTYDLATSTKRTAHHSPLYGSNSAHTAVQFLLTVGVPAEKICIGTPLYNHGWKQVALDGQLIGAAASGANHGGDMLWETLARFEAEAVPDGTPGWHMGYDETAHGAYLWNDDPASPYYRNLLTYDSARSLDAKLEYIITQQLGGIIVWQAGGDDAAAGWPMITRMHQKLHP